MEDLLSNIRKLLKRRKLSMKVLSDKSGVPKRTIQEWMYNGRDPNLFDLQCVLQVLGYELKLKEIGQ